jgi:hypothetical protein
MNLRGVVLLGGKNRVVPQIGIQEQCLHLREEITGQQNGLIKNFVLFGIYYEDQIKRNCMGRPCSMHEGFSFNKSREFNN